METIRLTVTSEEAGQRADSLLARRLEGLTRSAAARLLEEGRVTDRGRPAAKNLRVQPGQVLEVQLPEPEEPEARPQNIPLDVVYEDQDVIVVNKPTGMVVHPAPGHPDGTLVNACCITAGKVCPASGARSVPASSTASTGTPAASLSPPKTMQPIWPWRPSWRTTPWPGPMNAWRWGIFGRTAAPWTPPSAAIRWTASAWRWCPVGGAR